SSVVPGWTAPSENNGRRTWTTTIPLPRERFPPCTRPQRRRLSAVPITGRPERTKSVGRWASPGPPRPPASARTPSSCGNCLSASPASPIPDRRGHGLFPVPRLRTSISRSRLMNALSISQRLSTTLNAEPHELRPSLMGFALFFCLFTGYFMLRPIRESLGIAAGVENLQWLFTATFFVMLAAVPLFAWLSSRVPRLHFIDWVYGFFCVNLLTFAALFHLMGESPWLARVFYVWISVYNLFVVSVGWSLMADVFDAGQAKRLFAFIAAGASVGGLVGPALSALLAASLGEAGLMLLAGLLLGVGLALKYSLMRWREVGGAGRPDAVPAESTRRPLPGNPFSGITRVL